MCILFTPYNVQSFYSTQPLKPLNVIVLETLKRQSCFHETFDEFSIYVPTELYLYTLDTIILTQIFN